MAGMYTIGEAKVRPGAYSNIQKTGTGIVPGAVDGITAVLFRADWGPVGKVVEVTNEENYEDIFGNGETTDALKEAFAGGAKTVICCRVGGEGSVGSITLKTANDEDGVVIKANYVGTRAFAVTVRDSLSNDQERECIIYSGTKAFEKVTFAKAGDEVDALVAALTASKNFSAEKKGSGVLADVAQENFVGGTNPTVTSDSYNEGLSLLEAYSFNTICVDTETKSIHSMVAAFLDRIKEVGQFAQVVVAEGTDVALETRMANAAAYNNEKVIYIVNPHLSTGDGELKGYQMAARIAGMVAATPSSRSLTHTIITGATEIIDSMTPSQMVKAEQLGGLVLSMNKSGQVWIDNAINTLVTPSDDQDDGWKKIRRTKTRYELIERAMTQADSLVGKVNNDTNGRATIISQIQSVVDTMIGEEKLSSGIVYESTKNPAIGDSCWFEIDAVDKDSAEHVYLSFIFRYATE